MIPLAYVVCGPPNVHAPSTTARTSRVGGRKLLVGGPVQSLKFVGSGTVKPQGGRKRHRPVAAPLIGPGSTPMVPQSRSLGAPVVGFRSMPYKCTTRLVSVLKPSKRVMTAASLAPTTVNPPVPINETSIATFAGLVPAQV